MSNYRINTCFLPSRSLKIEICIVYYTLPPIFCLIDCGILLNPENGIVDLTSGTTFGKVATYICVTPGYVLSGLKTRECGMNGWSDVEPVCVIKGL